MAGVQVIDRVVTTNTVGDTVLRVPIYSFLVPGGTLGTNKRLRLQLYGKYRSNLGAPGNIQFWMSYAGFQTVLLPTFVAAAGLMTYVYGVTVFLTASNSALLQAISGSAVAVDNSGGPASSISHESPDPAGLPGDSTIDQTIEVLTQWGQLPNLNPSVYMYSAFLELLD